MSDERVVPAPTDPMAVARAFVAENYMGIGGTLLLRHYSYAGDHWPEDDERRVSSELWQWLEGAQYEKVVKEEIILVPFEPTRYKIANVLEALKAIGHIAEGMQPPVWLVGAEATPIIAGEVVPLLNGILDFSTRELRSHTPELFEQHVLPFEYDSAAAAPTRWLRFLEDLWVTTTSRRPPSPSGSGTSSRATPRSRRCASSSARRGPGRARSPAS